MHSPLSLNGALAAEIADFALEAVERQVPNHDLSDVVVHLCGATAGILLWHAGAERAANLIEGWRVIMIEIITLLADSECQSDSVSDLQRHPFS